MVIIPAIDLKGGQCVRLVHGDMNRDTVYSDDPGAMGKKWQDLGAQRLHVVDLDGAFAAKPVNGEAIRSILANISMPMQLGGGIRNLETIQSYLDLGVHRVILGSVAYREPQLVLDACKQFAGHVSVGIDARDGKVAVEGWAESTEMTSLDLARRFEDAGVSEIIFTDISRDGALSGPNIEATRRLAEAISIPVIISGGVSSLDDIKACVAHAGKLSNGNHMSGVITGKALYDGRLDYREAKKLADAVEFVRF